MILCELYRALQICVVCSLSCMHSCKAISVGASLLPLTLSVVHSRTFSIFSVNDLASHFTENIKNFQHGYLSFSPYFCTSTHSSLLFQRKIVLFFCSRAKPFTWAHSLSYTSFKTLLHPSTPISYPPVFLFSFFFFLAASGLSCGAQALCCGVRASL